MWSSKRLTQWTFSFLQREIKLSLFFQLKENWRTLNTLLVHNVQNCIFLSLDTCTGNLNSFFILFSNLYSTRVRSAGLRDCVVIMLVSLVYSVNPYFWTLIPEKRSLILPCTEMCGKMTWFDLNLTDHRHEEQTTGETEHFFGRRKRIRSVLAFGIILE